MQGTASSPTSLNLKKGGELMDWTYSNYRGYRHGDGENEALVGEMEGDLSLIHI